MKVRGKKHPQAGGRDILQLAEVQCQGFRAVQAFAQFRFQFRRGHGILAAFHRDFQRVSVDFLFNRHLYFLLVVYGFFLLCFLS